MRCPLSIGTKETRLDPNQLTQTSVFDLTPAEKLQLVEDLWDDLAANPGDVPVHDWQIEEVERRKAEFEENPQSGVAWEQVKREMRERHGR